MVSEKNKRRLRDLENAHQACWECATRPTRVHVVYEGEEAPDVAEYCPECGRLVEGVVLRVEYEKER